MVRIFITSNPISTILMSMYALRTHQHGVKDLLCIDKYLKKKTLIKLINESATLHKWDQILDFSTPVEDDFNLKPGTRTQFMRKVKHLPVIKNIYDLLLTRHLTKRADMLAGKIKVKLEESGVFPGSNENVQLFQLTQTELNIGAEKLFPNAEVFYMEHGTVDYIYVIEKKRKSGYICIFKENYEKYLNKRNITFPVFQCLTAEEFDYGFKSAAPSFDLGLKSIRERGASKYVLILMDALEKFNPLETFWTDFIDRCLQEIKDPSAYLFLIKPHPTQSNEVIELTRAYFEKLGLNFLMLTRPEHVNLSVETIYAYYRQQIEHVFSTFSAAIFYMAYFYGEQSKFYFSYDFVGKYIENAPKQYRDSYEGLKPLIDEVFSSKHLISLK